MPRWITNFASATSAHTGANGSMASDRQIIASRVLQARRTERISISTPGDFRLGAPEAFDRARLGALLPYCLDIARRRSLYVSGVSTREASAAPFYYLHLRRDARDVVSVPWEAGAIVAKAPRAPIFLFSPGRCGSTLLSRILFAAGIANVSEPDFHTQLTSAWASGPFNPWREQMRAAVANMGSDLAAALGDAPVVKLRAESCRAPQLLLQADEPRTIFLTRGFAAWARSNARTFGNGARKSVAKYLRAITCYSYLKRNGSCQLLRYEELERDPLKVTQALGLFLGRNIAPEAARAAMMKDSQDGTPLGRDAHSGRAGWEKRFDEALALWNSDRLRRSRDRLAIDELQTG